MAFLSGLVDSMTSRIAKDRPSAASALEKLHEIVNSQSSSSLRWRLRGKDSGVVRRVLQDIGSATREGIYIVRRLICKILQLRLKVKGPNFTVCITASPSNLLRL